MDLTTKEIANKYGLRFLCDSLMWGSIKAAMLEYAAQEAQSYAAWLSNEIRAGRTQRTQRQMWVDYTREVLDQQTEK